VAVRLANPAQEFSLPPELPAPHAGWVQFIEAGRDPVRGPYQVLELLQGETLRAKVERAPLSAEPWLAFVRQSLDAVAALHEAGWVHGDLNADNFLQREAPPAAWKLLELPFLRAAGASPLFGSIYTLAPERFAGQTPDDRSDLYALGCLYYYAACGEYPHAGANHQEIAISLLRFAPMPLREKSPDFSAGTSAWVMSLLERDVQRRPSSVAAARQLLAIA
jgi:serine/threonine protein kinase